MDNICERIDNLISANDVVIVGIDGMCASGKTTLAEKLAQIYDANLFHTDDFFLPKEKRTEERLFEYDGNVDYERLFNEVLIPVREQREFYYSAFDCHSQSLKKPVLVTPKKLNIVEGTYTFNRMCKDNFDLSILFIIDKELQNNRISALRLEPLMPYTC